MVDGPELIEKIHQKIRDLDLGFDIFVKEKNGLNNIVFFDEPDLYPGEKNRFRIGNGNIMVFDGDNLFWLLKLFQTNLHRLKIWVGLFPYI